MALYGANNDVFPRSVENTQKAGVDFSSTDDKPVDGFEPEGGWDADFDNWDDGGL